VLSCAKQLLRPCLSAGIALLLALPGAQLSAAEEQPAAVSDLRYGVSLYHYFQQDYFAALSELQVADLRGGIVGHGNAPLVLRGAMSLAFGLDRSASQIFEQALDQHSSERVRNAAWFYLSKMRFRRGDWQGATASLLRIEGKLDPRLRDEFNAMQVNVALRSGDLATAVSAMDDRDRKNPWQPYLYYNLGTAHIRADKKAEGIEYLDRLAAMKLSSTEYRAIRDKALTAAGFSLMQQQQYTDAVARFSKVQLDSPIEEQALLGYGWSAVELGDYHQALAPWQLLAGRSPLRPAVQEALLAVPYAYEKLGSLGSALSEFEAAEAVFSDEINRLDALKVSLSPRQLLETVRFTHSDPELTQGHIDPELVGLIELLSGDQFQLYSRDMRDLDALGQRLDYWRRNIDIYRDMLEHRAQGRQHKLARMSASDYSGKLEGIVQQRAVLAGELAEAGNDTEMPAIADAETKALWVRLETAQQALLRLQAAGENVALEQQQLDRYRGLLLWRASDRSPHWRRQASKRLQALDQAIANAQDNMRRLRQVADEVPDIAPFEQRLQQLQHRLQVQTVALDQSLRATEASFYLVVVTELEQQQNRLRYYQSQARLARARLYDRAQLEASR
jgi:tetratricopeptide (TPR) repeat protein